MPTIRLRTRIEAPIERCFDLARSIDLHVHSQDHHSEEAVAGVTAGLIGPDEEVTWRASHFGIRQTLTTRITEFARPTHFRDEMVRGVFASFGHDHDFERHIEGTSMTDVLRFEAPLGLLGRLVSRFVLVRHLTRLLSDRATLIRWVAESEEWKRYLP